VRSEHGCVETQASHRVPTSKFPWADLAPEAPAERMEERHPAKRNAAQPAPPRTQGRNQAGTVGLDRVRDAARKDGGLKFTALLHHADVNKPDGRKRALGIAVLEDKIVQHAVSEILQNVHEPDFLGFSYGFRKGKSQHNALDALYMGISHKKVNWILDADIEGFFDTIGHDWMIGFLEGRIGDRRVLRLIRNWLEAGISEDGEVTKASVGTLQGAVI